MKDEKIIRNFYAKPTDTHQYLDSSSCQPDQCKMVPLTAKLYALIEFVLIMPSLIRMPSMPSLLYEGGYSERIVRQEILKIRKIPSNELFKKERNHPE